MKEIIKIKTKILKNWKEEIEKSIKPEADSPKNNNNNNKTIN